jgi:hypothetical protein
MGSGSAPLDTWTLLCIETEIYFKGTMKRKKCVKKAYEPAWWTAYVFRKMFCLKATIFDNIVLMM